MLLSIISGSSDNYRNNMIFQDILKLYSESYDPLEVKMTSDR